MINEIIRMDGRAVCERCEGTAHDYVSHHKGELLLQCCYCLALTKILGEPPVVQARTSSNPGTYTLKYGRYKGMQIRHVADLGDRGVEYLRILAGESPKLKGIISEYLDSRSAVSVSAATASHHPEPHRSPSRTEASITGSP